MFKGVTNAMQMAAEIVMRRVEELIPYARNARTHSDEQVAQIAGSIREFGFTNPLLLDGANGILAGMAACSPRASSA
jgi:ParB-like chromosome segregation protein Spo0J